MTAEEKRCMLAAIFDTVVANAEGSHGCYRLLTERKTGLEGAVGTHALLRVRDGGLDLPAPPHERGAPRSVSGPAAVKSRRMPNPKDWFDHQTKHVLAMAQAAAVGLNQGGLGAEHVLLGILVTECAAQTALQSISVDAERARLAVQALVPPGDKPVPPRDIVLMPSALGAIDRANTLRAQKNSADLTPTLLLLALLADEESVATRVLLRLGATPERVRKALTTD
jgi:ATP-dependent Clp protease ATP-binding subunit ClpC